MAWLTEWFNLYANYALLMQIDMIDQIDHLYRQTDFEGKTNMGFEIKEVSTVNQESLIFFQSPYLFIYNGKP